MLAGKWDVILNTPLGKVKAIITFVEENGTYTGSMIADGNDGDVPVTDIEVNGNDFKCETFVATPVGKLTVKLNGTVDGDTISGKAHAKMMSMLFSATRA